MMPQVPLRAWGGGHQARECSAGAYPAALRRSPRGGATRGRWSGAKIDT